MLLICMMIAILASGVASAHVTVLPNQVVQGTYEKFAVRVPTEKDVPTVKVEVKFPVDDVSISRFEPKPGWSYEVSKDANGKITGVVWTAQGEGLKSTEFGEFYMQGKVGDNASKLVWKAYQTYKDGTVVEWTGAEGSDKPASVTAVKPKPTGAATDSHGNTAAAAPAAAQPAASAGAGSQAPLYMSAGALVLSLIALIASLTRRKASSR
ncbi:YcnI family protein [Paenibacillus hamazuiensis]|uniref:YcnI family copper-binding membrane protein n=1 Tax=Paenibacillus hamazuiensis TaxID=2936508 RepID=UPI003B846A0A